MGDHNGQIQIQIIAASFLPSFKGSFLQRVWTATVLIYNNSSCVYSSHRISFLGFFVIY